MISAESSQPWRKREFIFVGGMHRSGTTLLASIIGASKDASGLESSGAHMGEGQFLQDVYQVGREYGGTASWALNEASHLTERDADQISDAGERLWNSWSQHWDLSRRYLVEKTPLNLTKMRFLQENFPNSRFIVITRHPITQALAVRKWRPHSRWGKGIDELVHNWVRGHETFRADEPFLNAVEVFRYEDFMSDAAREVRRLEQFLSVSLPGAANRFDGSRAAVYEEEWAELRGRSRLSISWRDEWKGSAQRIASRLRVPKQANAIERQYRARIASLGYHLDDLRSAEPWPTDS